MDSAHVLDDALGEVGHAQADGPVGVTLQPDHLVGAKKQNKNLLHIHHSGEGLLLSSLLPPLPPPSVVLSCE